MRNKKIVLLFEDDPQAREKRCRLIQGKLGKNFKAVQFRDESTAADKNIRQQSLEDILADKLKTLYFNKGEEVGLIVCDMALERYINAKIYSASIVSSVAESMAIPICLYEANTASSVSRLKQRKSWTKESIIIDANEDSFGKECAGVFKGFIKISDSLEAINDKEFKKLTPANIMASILKKKEETNRIALYGMGEQMFLTELMPYIEKGDFSNIKKRYRRLLGNWLYTSILRFPGILVNTIAAASYLNIDGHQFNKKEVNDLFKSAKYTGPFSECESWWWRRDLDVIVGNSGCMSGLEYARKKGFKNLKSCKCSEKNNHDAGYYCMLKQKPVCEKHSQGGISWFPSGADLSRITTSEYTQWGPFLGL